MLRNGLGFRLGKKHFANMSYGMNSSITALRNTLNATLSVGIRAVSAQVLGSWGDVVVGSELGDGTDNE